VIFFSSFKKTSRLRKNFLLQKLFQFSGGLSVDGGGRWGVQGPAIRFCLSQHNIFKMSLKCITTEFSG